MSGWAGGGRHAAKPLGGRSGERRQAPPAGRTRQSQRGTYGWGTGSTAWWWWGRAGRPRQGDGAAQGLGYRAPSSLHSEGTWKGSRQQLQGWCGVSDLSSAEEPAMSSSGTLAAMGCTTGGAKAVSSFGVQGLKPAG